MFFIDTNQDGSWDTQTGQTDQGGKRDCVRFGVSKTKLSLSAQSLLNFLANYYSYFFIHFFPPITPKTSVKIHNKQSR